MTTSSHSLAVHVERWPIAGTFTISRGAKTEAVVVVAEVSDGRCRGRGECVPYARYGETVEGVAAAIDGMARAIAQRPRPRGACRPRCRRRGAQCARLRALGSGRQAGRPAGRTSLRACRRRTPLTTAYTISLGSA